MGKLYGFDEAGRREYRQIKKVVLGGGTRSQTKVYKKWERGRGGGVGAIIVHGLAGSNVSGGTYTITLSEATIMQGYIPSSVTTITAADTHGWGITDGQLVWVMLQQGLNPAEDNFQTFQAGCP